MTECERLSERMPIVAAGTASWSARESAHLASCPECSEEWRLVSAARRLAEGTGMRQPPEELASAVLARVRLAERDERSRRTVRRVGWGSLALAASLLLAVALRGRGGAAPAGVPDPVEGPVVAVATVGISLPELDGAEAEDLQAVLDAFDGPLTESSTLGRVGAGELEPEDLERVLRAWEG